MSLHAGGKVSRSSKDIVDRGLSGRVSSRAGNRTDFHREKCKRRGRGLLNGYTRTVMLSVIGFCMAVSKPKSRASLAYGSRTLDLGVMDVDIGEMMAKERHSYMDRL